MYDEMQERVEGFASLILRRYFCESDVEFLISTFDDDIVWLGAGAAAAGRGGRRLWQPVFWRAGKIWRAVICTGSGM